MPAMFDIGLPELFMVCLVALIVMGPGQLPSVMRSAGRFIDRARKVWRDMKYAVRRAMEEEGADE
jgi:sec-independent protein translocase protein TatB